MTFTKAIELAADTTSRTPELPGHFLNCYEISDSSKLAWAVHIYVVDRIDSQKQTHNDRGEIKNIVWKLRKQFAGRCRGVGYVIDLDERTVAVPAIWDLPSPIEVDGYRVTRECTVRTSASEPRNRAIIAGIIREAVKGHFKSNNSEALGLLWQDYNAFCQMPSQSVDAEYLLCRRFSVVPKVLRNNRWVLEFVISTVTLDANTFADYYRQGKVDVLADMIEAKRANRLTRQNRPTAIRVWRNETTDYQSKTVILELADPSTVIGHETLSHHVQSSLAAGTIRCQSFNGPQTDIPFDQIRLVLDTQITQDEHAETIIEPGERERLMRHLRDFIDEADIYGHSLYLA